MKNIDNLVYIYNDEKDDIKNIILEIYSEFVENELKDRYEFLL